jgi:uncharacterized protein YvpB
VKILKAFAVIVIFCVAIVALLIVKGQTQSNRLLHDIVFIETLEAWEKCVLDNCRINYDRVAVEIGGENGSSSITTYSISEDGSEWHRFDYIIWGDTNVADSNRKHSIEGVGRVDVDVLKLQKPMRLARILIECSGRNNSKKMFLRRLALSFSNDNPNWRDYKKHHPQKMNTDYDTVKLSVPYITQRSVKENKLGGACSPTSVSMVLNYHDKGVIPSDIFWEAYDYQNEIIGNWPFNVQAAFLNGLSKTWVDRHCGFDEIYEEIAEGKPVVISIKFGYDELPNSPFHETTEGHIVVVVGFAGPDTVICNDPAGHGVDDGIIKYPRKELEKAWIGHTAVAYHLWP